MVDGKDMNVKDLSKYSWHFKMDLGNGIVTPGIIDPKTILPKLQIPEDLTGWTVLDIGSFEGQYAFECERRGAARVVALDSDRWAWKPRISIHGKPRGKINFDLAKELSGSKVEDIIMDAEEISPEAIGEFDLVLFLGIFYHMRHPLNVLEKVASVTKNMLIVETHTTMNSTTAPVMEFYPGKFHGDNSNWWGPNKACVLSMLNDVGFTRSEIVCEPIADYPRITFHAWK